MLSNCLLAYGTVTHSEKGIMQATRSEFSFMLLQAHIKIWYFYWWVCLLLWKSLSYIKISLDEGQFLSPLLWFYWLFFSSILHYLCGEGLFLCYFIWSYWFPEIKFPCDRLALNSYVAQAGLKLEILLPQSPKGEDSAVMHYPDSCGFIWKLNKLSSPILFHLSTVRLFCTFCLSRQTFRLNLVISIK